MTEDAAQRGELRELLFDGVAPPPDGAAMFDRTFAAADDDGAHLLPPEALFDEPIVVEDPPADPFVADPAFDDPDLDDPDLDDGADGTPDDGVADPAAEWAGTHDHGADDAAGVDHHHDW